VWIGLLGVRENGRRVMMRGTLRTPDHCYTRVIGTRDSHSSRRKLPLTCSDMPNAPLQRPPSMSEVDQDDTCLTSDDPFIDQVSVSPIDRIADNAESHTNENDDMWQSFHKFSPLASIPSMWSSESSTSESRRYIYTAIYTTTGT
jgi:hypothetical protein